MRVEAQAAAAVLQAIVEEVTVVAAAATPHVPVVLVVVVAVAEAVAAAVAEAVVELVGVAHGESDSPCFNVGFVEEQLSCGAVTCITYITTWSAHIGAGICMARTPDHRSHQRRKHHGCRSEMVG